jgi:hypothetical protein
VGVSLTVDQARAVWHRAYADPQVQVERNSDAERVFQLWMKSPISWTVDFVIRHFEQPDDKIDPHLAKCLSELVAKELTR